MCFEDSREASQTSLREVTSKALRDWGLFTLTQRLSDEGEVDNALNVTSSLSNLEKIRSDLRIGGLERDLAAKTKELKEDPENAELKAEIDSLTDELDTVRLEEARKLVEHYPNDHGNRFEFGRLLFKKGEVDTAIEQFQISQRSAKVRVQSLMFLGNCFKHKKQYDLAVQQYATVKSEISGMNDQKKDVIYELAECYEKMGKTDEAIAEYKSIYSVDISYRDVAEKINQFYSGGGAPPES